MRQSPGNFMVKALLIPIGMFSLQVAQKHAPGAGIHLAGNTESLGPRLGADDLRHLIIHHLDDCRQQPSAAIHVPTLSNARARRHEEDIALLLHHRSKVSRWWIDAL